MGDNVRIRICRGTIVDSDTGGGKDRFLADVRGERMIRGEFQRDLMRCDVRGVQWSGDSAMLKGLARTRLSLVSPTIRRWSEHCSRWCQYFDSSVGSVHP